MSEREFNYIAWADVDLDKKVETKNDVPEPFTAFPQCLAQFVNRMSGHE